MNALLHVEKEKGVQVAFKPSIDEYFPIVEDSTSLKPELTAVAISSYSKEANVLDGSIARTRMELSFVPKGFCQYLYDRKKAGVINYRNVTLYVLPPSDRNDTVLSCISSTSLSSTPSKIEKFDQEASVAGQPRSQSTSSSSRTTVKPENILKPISEPSAGKKDDFLSSLLNKMQGTSKLRTSVGVAAPTTVLARVEIVDRYEALTRRIRGQLEAFSLDPTFMELRLEPMDKDGMYVVHDVVDDYPDLASIAIGDLEERHVVVFRRGFHPEGVDIHQQGTMVKNFSRKKKDTNYGKAVSTNSLQAESISIAKVNPDGDTRDRRTIEEIQQEMKRRKLGLN